MPEKLNYAQEQRLRLIELALNLYGFVGRELIKEYFGVELATVTRDFKLYSTLAPNNAVFNGATRRWIKAETFKAIF